MSEIIRQSTRKKKRRIGLTEKATFAGVAKKKNQEVLLPRKSPPPVLLAEMGEKNTRRRRRSSYRLSHGHESVSQICGKEGNGGKGGTEGSVSSVRGITRSAFTTTEGGKRKDEEGKGGGGDEEGQLLQDACCRVAVEDELTEGFCFKRKEISHFFAVCTVRRGWGISCTRAQIKVLSLLYTVLFSRKGHEKYFWVHTIIGLYHVVVLLFTST